MTLNPSRRDIYGISADTFYFENPFFMENSSNFSTPPQSPTSLSSLTLHTISLSTNEHSPAESQILSPRVMDVSIRPQPFSPPKSTYQFSNFMLEKASKSPFLLEEKSELSTSSVTEEEWVPPIECLNSQTATSDQFDCHHSHVSLPRLQIESTSNISQGRNPGSHDLIIDTSKPQSKKFYTLRRKISLMLFNHEEGETPTSFQKLSFPEQQLLLVSHSSHNPLNDSTASEGSQDEDQYDVNLADMMTPISQSTTISTNSDDLPTKSYWLTWKNFDFKWKKSKKTHHQRSYSNQSDDFPELSTIKPFTS